MNVITDTSIAHEIMCYVPNSLLHLATVLDNDSIKSMAYITPVSTVVDFSRSLENNSKKPEFERYEFTRSHASKPRIASIFCSALWFNIYLFDQIS